MNLVGTLTTSRKKWLIASSVMFGTILVVMDMNMVSVALPQMMGTFGKTQSAITWVATSYIIAELVLVTMAGWLSTVLGRKRLYLLSFLLFILASALAGTAHTFAQMLAYRTLQGIGGGSLVPLTGAILRENLPTPGVGDGHGHLWDGSGDRLWRRSAARRVADRRVRRPGSFTSTFLSA